MVLRQSHTLKSTEQMYVPQGVILMEPLPFHIMKLEVLMFVQLVGTQMAHHLYLISKLEVGMYVQREVTQMVHLQFRGMK
ncbi:hypothetical protein DOT36_16790 [Vibrio vulnificus]|nr:hypothetical protein DOT36_16790 [Vibrio vulnificus]